MFGQLEGRISSLHDGTRSASECHQRWRSLPLFCLWKGSSVVCAARNWRLADRPPTPLAHDLARSEWRCYLQRPHIAHRRLTNLKTNQRYVCPFSLSVSNLQSIDGSVLRYRSIDLSHDFSLHVPLWWKKKKTVLIRQCGYKEEEEVDGMKELKGIPIFELSLSAFSRSLVKGLKDGSSRLIRGLWLDSPARVYSDARLTWLARYRSTSAATHGRMHTVMMSWLYYSRARRSRCKLNRSRVIILFEYVFMTWYSRCRLQPTTVCMIVLFSS